MNGSDMFKSPLYVAWELTHKCTAECLHCYSSSGPSASCADELTTSESMEVIRQLATAGVLVLAFSGGEPLLRKDWSQLFKYAKELGLLVNVGSNGTCINRKTISTLKK